MTARDQGFPMERQTTPDNGQTTSPGSGLLRRYSPASQAGLRNNVVPAGGQIPQSSGQPAPAASPFFPPQPTFTSAPAQPPSFSSSPSQTSQPAFMSMSGQAPGYPPSQPYGQPGPAMAAPPSAGFSASLPRQPYGQSGFAASMPPADGFSSSSPRYGGPPGFVPAAPQAMARSSQPPHRASRGKVLLLSLLAVCIVLGGLLGAYVVRANSTVPLGQTGPFVAPAYSNKLVNDVQHLASHMTYKQLASLYVSRMSLDEELGQLLMVQYSSASYSDDLDTMINQQHVGGIILYAGQLQTVDQAKQDIAHMQQRADFPLLIGIDEEGWNVTRLSTVYPQTHFMSAYDMRQSGDPTVANSQGKLVGQDLMNLGINVDFAPDVDVSSDNNYIGWDYRAFGQDVSDVIKYAPPYTEGLQSTGVIATLKHFPGLGSVPRGTDPHAVLPVVSETKDQLEQTDLAPYKYFLKATNPLDQPGMIMPTDVLIPSVDPTYPSEFSHTFITGILRNELGYDGVVISDSVIMGGVQVNNQSLTEAQASLLAIQAGDDMVLDVDGSDQVSDVISTFKTALQNGTLTKARIDEAATRIIALKIQRHLMPNVPPQS